MRVLVACEFSGIVRDAFIAKGHDAISCDLLPAERPGPHYQGDVRDILNNGFDLMIAHPPCTHLAVSGARWFTGKEQEQVEALEFVRVLLGAPIERICLENPVSIISTRIRKPDQIIQPWMFGDDAAKTTCLWLKGLPLLKPRYDDGFSAYLCRCGYRFGRDLGKYGCPNCCADEGAAILVKPEYIRYPSGKRLPIWYANIKGKRRALTFPGIAAAMAEQWRVQEAKP